MNSNKFLVSFNLALTLKSLEHAFKESIAKLQIELPAESFGMLMITYFRQDVIQQDIAEMIKKDKSAVLRQIDVLESKGFVRRQTDEHDRRKNIIVITDKGKEIAQTLMEKEHELFLSLSQGVDEQDMKSFLKVLATLRNNAQKI